MIRFSIVVVVLFVAAASGNPTKSEERRRVAGDQEPAAKCQRAAEERPMSIFNDQVRRFKFRLEDTLVTAETAQSFMLMHQGRNDPQVIGAYADSKTNSLVVVGPPEAEQSIRITLATWIVERQGVSPQPLKVQKRTLEFQRKELLRTMAELEVLLTEDENEERATQLGARLQLIEDELQVVEKQIQVVNRYIQRLRE